MSLAPGTAKGWRWQRNWSDLYSIVVEGCVARNPWKRGIRLVGANETVTLYRPVGPEELQQIKLLNFKSRLPEQPIFYPVLTEDYAAKIASEWNVPASGSGYVTRFKIRRSFISRYQMQDAGGRQFQEYWIPASDLDELNQNIMGLIEVTKEFHRD